MKIPGMLAVACACFSYGIIRLQTVKKAIGSTEELMTGMITIRSELAARLSPMNELLRAAQASCTGEISAFFGEAADRLESPDCASFSDSWDDLCRNKLTDLPEELCAELKKLGRYLGRFELEDQLSACDRLLCEAETWKRETARKYPEQRKLLLTLCGCAAAFTCLLIL